MGRVAVGVVALHDLFDGFLGFGFAKDRLALGEIRNLAAADALQGELALASRLGLSKRLRARLSDFSATCVEDGDAAGAAARTLGLSFRVRLFGGDFAFRALFLDHVFAVGSFAFLAFGFGCGWFA